MAAAVPALPRAGVLLLPAAALPLAVLIWPRISHSRHLHAQIALRLLCADHVATGKTGVDPHQNHRAILLSDLNNLNLK